MKCKLFVYYCKFSLLLYIILQVAKCCDMSYFINLLCLTPDKFTHREDLVLPLNGFHHIFCQPLTWHCALTCAGTPERGGSAGASPLLPFLKGGRGGKSALYKIYLFKNEQALAEVIICVTCESGVIACTEILRLYLLQA